MTLAKKDNRVATAFEAAERYGGRTQRMKIGDYYVPMGGAWQTGTGPNQPLTKRLRVCGIEKRPVNWESWIDFCKNGQECGDSWEDWEASYACAGEVAAQLKAMNATAVSQDTGLKLCGWKASTDDEFLVEGGTIPYEWAEGATVNSLQITLPLLSHLMYKDQDKFITDQRGSEELVGCWLDRFGIGRSSSPRVNYKSKVVNINTDTQIITLKNGSKYHYNVLFNTMPNGALSWNQIHEDGSLFTPKLSGDRVLALHGYHTPVYDKIFFQFPTNFWNSRFPRTQYFNIFAKSLHSCTIWQNMDLPRFLNGSNILYLTCTTPQSDYGEVLSKNEWKELLMPQLKNVFGNDIPDPTNIALTRWLNDPNFRGTYSNAPVEHNIEKFNKFYEPLGANKMTILTGEAYCFYLFGYMHAAILAAETSWCEYQVRIGVYPANTQCRKYAFDADGKRYPNFCWEEAIKDIIPIPDTTTDSTIVKRSVYTVEDDKKIYRPDFFAKHNLNVSDEKFQENARRKINRAMSILNFM
jgi:polyamine oxidase